MPKKKGFKKNQCQDFTINDCANAPTAVSRVKKGNTIEAVAESWDQIDINNFDIVEEICEDGTKSLVYKKRRNRTKSEHDNADNRLGIVYPEIVWYLISRFVKPEEVGRFAGINRATYAITNQESFWRMLYTRYCANHPRLPDRLHIEKSFKVYGLKQRVIRALYHTYDVFVVKISPPVIRENRPYHLVKRRCVNVWYNKRVAHWSVYFKFKKLCPFQKIQTLDFIEELSRIDANPEEDSQVLHVLCENFLDVPPLIGMTLSSVSVVLAQGFRHHRLHLGFSTSPHNISRDISPECTVTLDSVMAYMVFDWWHPMYPHFDNRLPPNFTQEIGEPLPVLKQDFFKTDIDL